MNFWKIVGAIVVGNKITGIIAWLLVAVFLAHLFSPVYNGNATYATGNFSASDADELNKLANQAERDAKGVSDR
jgi:hypothetical protein